MVELEYALDGLKFERAYWRRYLIPNQKARNILKFNI